MNEETTLAQYKVACDRAWEVVKERDADVVALKRRIRQLEVVRRQKIQLKRAQEELQDIDISGFGMPTYRGVPLSEFSNNDLIRLTKGMWHDRD